MLNCWKGLEHIDDEVFSIKKMTAMRLVGHKLTIIPLRLANELKNLKVLSLSNNNLEQLPNNIGDLIHLEGYTILLFFFLKIFFLLKTHSTFVLNIRIEFIEK